jgi:predicted pyridoxine 5'-phosphate oxidase superfamily flavin-nucleotide-binding protein
MYHLAGSIICITQKEEFDMAKLNDEAKQAIADILPLIGTCSRDGKPNVSAKRSLRVLDDDHLVFADLRSPRTIANLRENPQLTVTCLNHATRKGCRIWGRGEIFDAGELFDQISAALRERNMTARHVVKVTVDEVETF